MPDAHCFSFSPVKLPDGSSVELALPADSVDPVVQAYLHGNDLNHYMVDWLLQFTEPGAHLVDLGCHVGTFAVPAAALGRKVLAVDASPLHVESVSRSAKRNQLSDLRVEWCAIDSTEGEIEFDENGLWGMVARSPGSRSALRVPSRRVDALVASIGWDSVAMVKMDVEGSELAAVESMGSLLHGPNAPIIIYESNGMTFDLFGYSIEVMRKRLEMAGYITCRLEAGRLIYCDALQLQPEAWLDVVALPSWWQKRRRFQVEQWSNEEMVARCLEWGCNEHRNVREYLYRALASQMRYPREDERIRGLRTRLASEFGASNGS